MDRINVAKHIASNRTEVRWNAGEAKVSSVSFEEMIASLTVRLQRVRRRAECCRACSFKF